MKPTLHVSNDFRALRKQLTQQLFLTPSAPFEQKVVLLPDLKQKNELLLRFLDDVDVVMGVDFMELGAGIQFLCKLLSGQTLQLPPLDLLTLHLLPLVQEFHSEKKAYPLAAALAMEFLRYGKFGDEKLIEWAQKEGWQQTLWNRVFSHWDIPSKLLDLPLKKPNQPLEIHLYKFSFLPELYYRFFEKVAAYVPVHIYQFSPCATFWTDTFSEKERIFLEKKVDAKVRDEWNAYLQDRPLLLAHLGKLARQTFRFFEEEDFPLEEHYVSPQSGTLLHQLQHQILHYQAKQTLTQDRSILLHPAASKRREVEILFTTLLSLDFKPSDIRIYAPDISAYAPYISLIFGAKESPFPFSISDLPRDQESPLLQAFLNLLMLQQNRFSKTAVLKFISSPPVRQKFRLKEKDVEAFGTWMEKGGVKWGMDRQHRQLLLSGREMHEQGEAGTWEDTFKPILHSFTTLPKERLAWERPLLDFSDAETFGICVSLVRSLEKDLTFLETASLSLPEWSEKLRLLLNRYFEVDEEELSTFKWIEEKFALLESEALPKDSYPFLPLFEYIKKAFQEKTGKKEAGQIEALRFASLKLAAPDQAPVICLLGLDETQFPRVSSKSSLCELNLPKQPLSQYEDRLLFLESLFAASSHFIMSYVSVSEEDGKEQAPSPIVQELLTILDPITITEKHPPFLFHAEYFDTPKPTSHLAFRAAQKFYASNSKPTPFIPEFLTQTPLPPSQTEDLAVDLKNLSRFAKHPLRFYLNQTLHLYLQYEERDEEFTLSPLTQMKLREQAHHHPFEEVFEQADLHGKLPLGRFKEIAHLHSSEEIALMQEALQQFGLTEKPQTLDLNLTVPLDCGRVAHLEGSLGDVTSEGLLFHGEKKLQDLLKIWPLYLAFAADSQVEKKDLLLSKTGERLTFSKLDPAHALATYLIYYEKALSHPSPFLPAWGQTLLEKGPHELAKKIEATSDPYALWVFRPHQYDPNVLFETWATLLQTTFQPLQEALNDDL
ncbi:exodeoxyribonuclease V subunit gamma [Simkania sp.]|uniref:exodeoxyribonuclease V subunit gamma n=1 Tax=Simkania sp. TaxID=34094 RepID=UPI003B52AA26